MLANYILETANAPGTATNVNLAGAPAGRRTFRSSFSSGANCYYFIFDGTQEEWGIGLLTYGSPDTLSRNTVIGNSAGTTAHLNFGGAILIYNEIPAERLAFFDANNILTTTNRAINTGTADGTFNNVNALGGTVALGGAAGTFKSLLYGTGGAARWIAASDGSDDYRIGRYDNVGNLTDYPLWIARSTGRVTFGQPIAVPPGVAPGDALNRSQIVQGLGWLKFPDGVIFQWGDSVGGTSGVQAFRINFPAAIGSINLTPVGPAPASFTILDRNLAGFSWAFAPNSAFFWEAIGI